MASLRYPGRVTRNFSWTEVEDREGHDLPRYAQRNARVLARKYLEPLREAVGFPLKVTSWYRSPEHSIEAAKDSPGAHTTGYAVDISAAYEAAYAIVAAAPGLGFTGIGLLQHGPPEGRYVHLDVVSPASTLGRSRPRVWTYNV